MNYIIFIMFNSIYKFLNFLKNITQLTRVNLFNFLNLNLFFKKIFFSLNFFLLKSGNFSVILFNNVNYPSIFFIKISFLLYLFI